MNNEMVEQIALANGFKLKKQLDGSMALNPYVFEFAKALLAASQPEGWQLVPVVPSEDMQEAMSDAYLGMNEAEKDNWLHIDVMWKAALEAVTTP